MLHRPDRRRSDRCRSSTGSIRRGRSTPTAWRCTTGSSRVSSRTYLDRVGEAITAAGFAMPMLCCSPDFTNPDRDARKRAVDREAELIARRAAAGRAAHGLPRPLRPALSRGQPQQGLEWVVDCIGEVLAVARARRRLGPREPLQGRLLEVSRVRPEEGRLPRAARARSPTAIISACSMTRRTRSSRATTRSSFCACRRTGSSACTPATAIWPRGRRSTICARATARWATRPTCGTA